MLWQVRALLEDRPGAMAALAVRCGQSNVNILGLQIFPAADGRVLDELVLHTPGGWGPVEVTGLCAESGVAGAAVMPCSPHALEDQPVRYLRAAQMVLEDPDELEEQLCRLLDAEPFGSPGSHRLVLDDPFGPPVGVVRDLAFTDTEVARAAELRRLAASVLGADPDPSMLAKPAVGESTEATMRPGSAGDASALVAMHARCSAETLYSRFHAPVPRISPRLARTLLEPADGCSLVLTVGRQVIAVGTLAVGPEGAELGLLVEDRWQRQGHGTRLLHALALEAAARGLDTVMCMVQPENDAVLKTVRRSGLRALVSFADGLTMYRIPVSRLAGSRDAARRGRGRPPVGDVTAPLVALLHERAELREVYPPADFIDQAVRGGA